MLLVISLGLSAAFLFALSASLQQHEAYQAQVSIQQRAHLAHRSEPVAGGEAVPDQSTFLLGLARRLPRSRLWRFGWLVNLTGFLVQGAALHFGSVALVQPLLVTQLLFALPLATWWSRQWPNPLAWLSGAAICGGVTVYLVTHRGIPWAGDPDRRRIVLAGLSAAAVVAVLVSVSAKREPQVQAALVAVAAGLCFAVSAALMKMTAEDLVGRGVKATAVDWPGYLLALSTFTGVVLGQWAFATGSLATAVAAMTVANPVASYLIGVLAFHVALVTGPGQLAAVAGAGALISVGVVGLSRSSVVRPRSDSWPDVIAPDQRPSPREGF